MNPEFYEMECLSKCAILVYFYRAIQNVSLLVHGAL